MKLKLFSSLLVLLLGLSLYGFSEAQTRRTRRPQPGKICGDPTLKCPGGESFEPHDLPLRFPQNAVIYESEPFYAVILKSAKLGPSDCEKIIPEDERREAQSAFPKNKVFTSRCSEAGQLYYEALNDRGNATSMLSDNFHFMAVYAGTSKAQAEQMLKTVQATNKFPGANIRRMRIGFNGT
ncbi:MAG: hypothetical protein JO360_10765 [Acidobacteria bacterium]|nr:hypothetical protein [Acidobacteriota bacterium]